LFLGTPKWIFISGPIQLAHAKIIDKRAKNHPKSQATPLRNNQISLLLHPNFFFKSTKIAPINSQEVSNMKIYKKNSTARLVGAN
jgi:hypothetical protein